MSDLDALEDDDLSLADLFRIEVETQTDALGDGLVELEADATDEQLRSLMRAAHSLKGAARLVDHGVIERLAHALEDQLALAARTGRAPAPAAIDTMLHAVDLVTAIPQDPLEVSPELAATVDAMAAALRGDPVSTDAPFAVGANCANGANGANRARGVDRTDRAVGAEGAATVDDGERREPSPASTTGSAAETGPREAEPGAAAVELSRTAASRGGAATVSAYAALPCTGAATATAARPPHPVSTSSAPGSDVAPAKRSTGAGSTPKRASRRAAERNVRVGASRLDRLLATSSELEIALRPLESCVRRLHGLKRRCDALLGHLPDALGGADELRAALRATSVAFHAEIEGLDTLEQQTSGLARRLHQASIETRMRPFGDGIRGFSRMVRDIARSLGKEAHLVVEGADTPVDREVLEALEGPLTHLLRNAVDHGLEPGEARVATGKPRRGTIELCASHRGGELYVTIRDDGGGIDRQTLERKIVERRLASREVVARMQDEEVWAFLFLPGFSTCEAVGEISGRGVGLDAVQSAVEELGGEVRTESTPGRGTRFSLRLPLTLAVTRALLVRAEGEMYAFPLARIDRTMRLDAEAVEELGGRPAVRRGDRLVGICDLARVLDLPESSARGESASLAAVVIGDPKNPASLVALRVGALVGVQELALRPLDPAFGDIPDVAAGAVLPDGQPVLVLDVPDLLRSIARRASRAQIQATPRADGPVAGGDAPRTRRVLVVDDSLTVREIERAILRRHGYEVETAVDGAAGWTALRSGEFDLVVSDVDMPNLDGIGLVAKLREDPTLRSLPAVIVSYKDRAEDRRRGLKAGADRYLTKGAFRDDTFIETVRDLIGEAEAVG